MHSCGRWRCACATSRATATVSFVLLRINLTSVQFYPLISSSFSHFLSHYQSSNQTHRVRLRNTRVCVVTLWRLCVRIVNNLSLFLWGLAVVWRFCTLLAPLCQFSPFSLSSRVLRCGVFALLLFLVSFENVNLLVFSEEDDVATFEQYLARMSTDGFVVVVVVVVVCCFCLCALSLIIFFFFDILYF